MLGLGKEHHLAAGTGRSHCGLDERRAANSQDHGVRAAAFRGSENSPVEVFRTGMNSFVQSEVGGDVVAL